MKMYSPAMHGGRQSNFRAFGRSVLFGLFVCVILSAVSCKSVDPAVLKRNASFQGRVPLMKVEVNDKSVQYCFSNGFGFSDIDCNSMKDLIAQNLSFRAPSGEDERYYLSVIVRDLRGEFNIGWFCFSTLTIYMPNFLGFPIGSQTWTVQLEAAVMDQNKRIVKLYRAAGVDTEYNAVFWGYRYSEDVRSESDVRWVASMNAIVNACDILRKKMEADYAGE